MQRLPGNILGTDMDSCRQKERNQILKNMMKNFEEYILDVKSQLEENATEYQKNNYVLYTFSNEHIDNNLIYFEYCYSTSLSAYKALLFFGDYLKNEEWQNELKGRKSSTL